MDRNKVAVTLDETVTKQDLQNLIQLFTSSSIELQYKEHESTTVDLDHLAKQSNISKDSPARQFPDTLIRTSKFLTHPVFNSYHCETDMLRYINYLHGKDLSLCNAMIPLGSCTMKLNATTEMIPVTWPEFGNIHPFVPLDQAKGYLKLFKELQYALCQATGFDQVSLQPVFY